MGQAVDVTIDHSLGTEEAKARIDGSCHRLGEMVSGARLIDQRWDDDTLYFSLSAMGQRVKGRLQVDEETVKASVDLPFMMSMYAGSIKNALQEEGPRLLE